MRDRWTPEMGSVFPWCAPWRIEDLWPGELRAMELFLREVDGGDT